MEATEIIAKSNFILSFHVYLKIKFYAKLLIIKPLEPPLLFSVRFMLSFFGFLLTTIQYMQRINMSVGIVCMINNTRLEELSLKNKVKSLIDEEFKNLTKFVKNETIAERQCAFTTLERSLPKVYFVKTNK
jgi:hypothetical protein